MHTSDRPRVCIKHDKGGMVCALAIEDRVCSRTGGPLVRQTSKKSWLHTCNSCDLPISERVPETRLTHDHLLTPVCPSIFSAKQDHVLNDEEGVNDVEGNTDPDTRSIAWSVLRSKNVSGEDSRESSSSCHHCHGQSFLELSDQVIVGICPLQRNVSDYSKLSDEDTSVASVRIRTPADPVPLSAILSRVKWTADNTYITMPTI